MMSQGQTGKHFMQDAIERKIEKFSSQNINVQIVEKKQNNI